MILTQGEYVNKDSFFVLKIIVSEVLIAITFVLRT